MKPIYLKSALKCDSFDVAINIKIQFFRVLVTIEPGRSLLQFVTTNCLVKIYKYKSSLRKLICNLRILTTNKNVRKKKTKKL